MNAEYSDGEGGGGELLPPHPPSHFPLPRDKRKRHVRHIGGRPMDYTSPADMRSARATQQQRRGDPSTHHYVIGVFVLQADDTVILHALATTPGVYELPAGELSPRQSTWYRWRTKQAARQWLIRNPQPAPLLVWNLDTLSCVAGAATPLERPPLPTPDPSQEDSCQMIFFPPPPL